MKKTVEKTKRKYGRGSLMLITLFFLTSGLLRLGGGTGLAIAREVETITQGDHETEASLLTCKSDEGLEELFDALAIREARVVKREEALKDRMQALAVAEVGFKRNLAALLEAESALKATLSIANTAAEDDLARLTSVYENMKPKDAATLFEEMAPEFSAGFLGRMRPDTAASVLAGLTPEKAYSISIILAGRNALVPTE